MNYIYRCEDRMTFHEAMNLIIVVALFVSAAQALPNIPSINEDLNDEWAMYKIEHGKVYQHDMEEYTRRLIWEQTLKYIQEHNLRYDLGKHSYFLGINQFSDLSHEEFLAKYIRFGRPTKHKNSVTFMEPLNMDALPSTVDWRTKGYVTPVKNQLQCGSCWAFPATGSLEGQYFRKNKHLVSFSEQQLLDCSRSYGNSGCEGGLPDNAFNYVTVYGIESESDYPYTAQDGQCKYNAAKVVTKIFNHTDLPSGNEQLLAVAVASVGPISVGIDANHPSFQSYKGGVYNEPACSSTELDHGVLVVGYGTDSGQKYWLVKNSWGEKWGIKGYIEMSKDRNNQCGIATWASFPNM